MFDLEKAIKDWKRTLRKNPGFEDGDIEELENHLRDEMDRLVTEGFERKEAFKKAGKNIGIPAELSSEMYKTRKQRFYLPETSGSGVFYLLPSYLKIAWRNLALKKGFSLINILGLSVGISACILIGMYVLNQLSYDDFHKDRDRIYRVLREFDIPDLHTTISHTPASLGDALINNIPGIESVVRLYEADPIVSYREKKFVETSFILAENGFFDLFSFPILSGKASLEKPNTLVISSSKAVKYFGGENPLGKTLFLGNTEFEVTGVMADVPENSHLKFDFVASMDSPDPDWGRNNFTTYVLLNENQEPDSLISEINSMIQTQTDPEGLVDGNDFIAHLQPLEGIHLGLGVSVDISSEGNITYLYLFIALAVFIIILACINFMNLATARSGDRSREVGMRKTLGARRDQIAFQFLGESILTTTTATLFALSISWLALPYLNSIASTNIRFVDFLSLNHILSLISFAVLIGLAAGFYPSIILSGFKPSSVLKGVFKTSQGDSLRKSLVIFQFTISVILIIGTGVIHKQLSFMKSQGLGFDSDHILVIKQAGFLGQSRTAFKQELTSLSAVENVASGFSVPGTFFINSMWSSSDNNSTIHNLNYSFIDFDYINTFKINILAGRSFSEDFASSDSNSVILNESAVKEFGWTNEDAISKSLVQGTREYKIVGVSQDFHYASLHSEVYPTALFGPRRSPRYFAVRLSQESELSLLLPQIDEIWKRFSQLPLEYSFLAEDLKAQYRSEDRLVSVFGVFAGLAIFIGSLGLLGLTAFIVSQRTKEIGIRKILGASASSILQLVSKDLIKLVLAGFIIATPIAWYLMNWWLSDFPYRVSIGPGIFLFAGILSISIALITVSWLGLKAALNNPIISLRSE